MTLQMRDHFGILTGTARVICLLSALSGICACGQTLDQTQPGCPSARPAFPAMTFDENNRYLANSACATEPLDRLKYIPFRGESKRWSSAGPR